jgi:hypothetical protein
MSDFVVLGIAICLSGLTSGLIVLCDRLNGGER